MERPISTADFLPYPLPPWEHDFKNLSVFCEVDKDVLILMIPEPLTLLSNVIQVSVMFFDCTVPKRPYFDAACMAAVRHEDVSGGYWFHAYTSTDQVMAGTREIWGYNMKLAEMALIERGDVIKGVTWRLGKKIMSLSMTPSSKEFTAPHMFPRIFLKIVPNPNSPDGIVKKVVMMDTNPITTVNIKGEGSVFFEPSEDDPLYRLEPRKVIGASFTAGHQVLPWGREVG